jgi:competence protein ComEC
MGWLAWLFLLYMIAVVSGLAVPQISSIEVNSVSPAFVWAYYVILAAVIWLYSRWKPSIRINNAIPVLRSGINRSLDSASRLPLKWAVPPLLIIAILVSLTAAAMPDDKLHISFLDVGEGDAILIQKGSQQILIDGGPSPQAISLELGDKMPFWDRTIDLVVLTHPHHDHLAGLVEVLQRFRLNQALYPDSNGSSPLYDRWLEFIKEKNIQSTIARAGQQIDPGEGVLIQVLNPPPTPIAGSESDIDNNSAVLRLRSGGISFLFAADIMQAAERKLIRNRADLTSTVLKVPHHGSDTSTTAEFLAVVNPQMAVITVGADNKFGHPDEEVLERLQERIAPENILRTDRHGTVEFITDGKRLWVEVEK